MSARPYLVGATFFFFVFACFATLSGDWRGFFSAESAQRMAQLVREATPPTHDGAYLAKVGYASLETLAISFIGTLLAAIGGLALALPGAGRWGNGAKACARLVMNVLRAIPELVWAGLLVVAAGLGPFTGTLALAVHTAGVLGRLFSESLENVSPEPYQALRNHGANAGAAFWYSTFPQVLPQLTSYTLYRWENNIRAAAVLGVVGGGGLGQMLHFHLSLFQMQDAATILIAMIVLVGIVDFASNRLRMAMST